MKGETAPVGTVAIHNGHVFKKVEGSQRWKRVNLINWEAANGPLPKGFLLKSKDGDRTNTDASNWVLMPLFLGITARRAVYSAPPELVEAVILNETVKHQLRAARAQAGLPDPIAKRGRRAIGVRRKERHKKKMEEDPVYREEHRVKLKRWAETKDANRVARMSVDPEYASAVRERARRKDKRRRDRNKDLILGAASPSKPVSTLASALLPTCTNSPET